MQLSREAIRRMVGTGGLGIMGGGGGEGGGISADFLAQNYVAIPYFNQLFTIHGRRTVTIDGVVDTEEDITLPPNVLPERSEVTEGGVTTVTETVITRIEALYDFNSIAGVAALGTNGGGGGGGGGADLNALLDSINDSSIGDIEPGASEVGKCLVWTANGWDWGTTGGGGGADLLSVWKSLTNNSSLSSYDNNTKIATAHIPDLSSTYVTWSNVNRTSNSSWGKIPFVNTGGSMDIGKTLEFHSSDNDSIDYNALIMLNPNSSYNGTQLYLPSSSGTLALTSQIPSLTGYATQTWVNQQGFLTSSSINDMATKTWVNGQGFVKSSGVTSVETGTGLTGGTITTTGTISINSTYQTYISHGESAYNSLDNYLLKTQGMRFVVQDNYIAARFVNADGSYDTTRALQAQGSGYIEWWSTGGYFNHKMGSVSIHDDANDDTCYLQIGGGRIYWDNTSKSLYVVQADGTTAANFVATGGVSSLGISTGGTPSVSALTVGTLTASSQLNVGGTSSFTGDMTVNTMTIGGNLSATNWQIPTTGYARFARLYLDSTRYVYVSSGHLYFYNGSTSVQLA